ncbi:MAG: TetR family transcriptional regulator [Actinobacteria bacterium]|nr:TetR family transcriptional regulator [Actinomycetota bacterium]
MPGKRAAQPVKNSELRRNLVEAEILERAAQLFSERGYAATSLQEIAAELGISRSSLYHYFSNKEEMLIRLVSDLVVSSELALKQMKASEDTDARAQLRGAVEALLGPVVEAPNRFRLLLTVEAELPSSISKRWRGTRRKIVAEVSGLIREGIRRGEFRPVDEAVATFTVLGMCNWVAWWPDREREDLEAVRRGIAEIAVAGLSLGEGESVPSTPQTAIAAARDQLDRIEALIAS